jgi:hypothetical protein
MVTLLMGLVSDLVFDSAESMRRLLSIELERYLQDRGFRSIPPARPASH